VRSTRGISAERLGSECRVPRCFLANGRKKRKRGKEEFDKKDSSRVCALMCAVRAIEKAYKAEMGSLGYIEKDALSTLPSGAMRRMAGWPSI
jgi:hypothetical protein